MSPRISPTAADDIYRRQGPPPPRSPRPVVPFAPPPPLPLRLRVVTTPVPGGDVTAIGRTWAPGDAASCRLCPRDECGVDDGGACLVQVPGRVDPAAAALFSLVDWRRAKGLPGRRVERLGDGAGPALGRG